MTDNKAHICCSHEVSEKHCSHSTDEHHHYHSEKGHDDHNHHHHHHTSDLRGKKLLFVILLNFIITLVEIVGGFLSNSLSLLSDAVHNLGDTLALVFAYIANKIGNKQADNKHTFGYKRIEILTAFFNALILILICLFLFKEAYERFLNPEPIKGLLMIIISVIGFLANWISIIVLSRDKDKNINMKAAYLHLLGDTLSSVAVIIGGVCIWLFDIVWIDPVITILVGMYIIYHTWGVLKESLDILMHKTPADIDTDKIIKQIETLEGVKDVHHLHVWRLNEENLHYESHISVKDNIDMEKMMEIRHEIESILRENKITHITLQFDYHRCEQNSNCWQP